jgi:hypothetical protein
MKFGGCSPFDHPNVDKDYPATCRQAFPVGRAPRLGDVGGLASDGPPLAPGMEYMSAADPEYIAFACAT